MPDLPRHPRLIRTDPGLGSHGESVYGDTVNGQLSNTGSQASTAFVPAQTASDNPPSHLWKIEEVPNSPHNANAVTDNPSTIPASQSSSGLESLTLDDSVGLSSPSDLSRQSRWPERPTHVSFSTHRESSTAVSHEARFSFISRNGTKYKMTYTSPAVPSLHPTNEDRHQRTVAIDPLEALDQSMRGATTTDSNNKEVSRFDMTEITDAKDLAGMALRRANIMV
ncbi:uncharacterized protein L203_100818 [Cryptococcus depauperatus CBS 7841]|uniref:Uncharacterized protein n=1 Tax=Cryptococcus depauperatus CBS 7841 TaxID=1295531 RepID=A0AAJ8JNW2_9TREE